jgi:hypothetical protein
VEVSQCWTICGEEDEPPDELELPEELEPPLEELEVPEELEPPLEEPPLLDELLPPEEEEPLEEELPPVALSLTVTLNARRFATCCPLVAEISILS